MAKGFWMFFTGCAIVCGLTLIPPEHGRWVALAILAVLFVASAIPRRVQPSQRRREARVRGGGSDF